MAHEKKLLNIGSIEMYGHRLDRLGKGAFGCVYSHQLEPILYKILEKREFGKSLIPEGKVAIKHSLDGDECVQKATFVREISSLITLSKHPNIVSLYGFETIHNMNSQSKFDRYIIMEYATRGTLSDYMKKYRKDMINSTGGRPHFPLKEIVDGLIMQLIESLRFCHKNGIWHRDVKPSNILLSYPLASTIPQLQNHLCFRVLLTDFGWSIKTTIADKILTRHTHTGGVCTLKYRAPEVLMGSQIYNEKIDIWSVGIIWLDLITNSNLYGCPKNKHDALAKIMKWLPWKEEDLEKCLMYGSNWVKQPIQTNRKRKRRMSKLEKLTEDPIIGEFLGKNGYGLLYDILSPDPTKRPSCEECLSIKYNYFDHIYTVYREKIVHPHLVASTPTSSSLLVSKTENVVTSPTPIQHMNHQYIHPILEEDISNGYLEHYERSVVVDSLMCISSGEKTRDETIHLAISIMDRYITKKQKFNTVNEWTMPNISTLFLIGLSSLYIATLYYEIWPITAEQLSEFVEGSIDASMIERMSNNILDTIEFELYYDTVWTNIIQICNDKGMKIATDYEIFGESLSKSSSSSTSPSSSPIHSSGNSLEEDMEIENENMIDNMTKYTDEDFGMNEEELNDLEKFMKLSIIMDICSIMLLSKTSNNIKRLGKIITDVVDKLHVNERINRWTTEEEKVIELIKKYNKETKKEKMNGIKDKYTKYHPCIQYDGIHNMSKEVYNQIAVI
jgi:serine/threonine protein kinase